MLALGHRLSGAVWDENWLCRAWGIPLDSRAGRKQFAGQMEVRRRAEGTGEVEAVHGRVRACGFPVTASRGESPNQWRNFVLTPLREQLVV